MEPAGDLITDKLGARFLVRRALVDDAPAAGALGALVFDSGTGRKIEAAVANNGDPDLSFTRGRWSPERSVVAMYWLAIPAEGGGFAGIIGLYQPRWVGAQVFYLGWFGVHPHIRGHGIGAGLLSYAKQRAAALGGRVLLAETSPEPIETVTFYERHGFTACGGSADFWENGAELLLMRCPIPQEFV